MEMITISRELNLTEADLKAEYGYVINDLRSMGILATILVFVLVIIEKIS